MAGRQEGNTALRPPRCEVRQIAVGDLPEAVDAMVEEELEERRVSADCGGGPADERAGATVEENKRLHVHAREPQSVHGGLQQRGVCPLVRGDPGGAGRAQPAQDHDSGALDKPRRSSKRL
jgi:hypothetical protein